MRLYNPDYIIMPNFAYHKNFFYNGHSLKTEFNEKRYQKYVPFTTYAVPFSLIELLFSLKNTDRLLDSLKEYVFLTFLSYTQRVNPYDQFGIPLHSALFFTLFNKLKYSEWNPQDKRSITTSYILSKKTLSKYAKIFKRGGMFQNTKYFNTYKPMPPLIELANGLNKERFFEFNFSQFILYDTKYNACTIDYTKSITFKSRKELNTFLNSHSDYIRCNSCIHTLIQNTKKILNFDEFENPKKYEFAPTDFTVDHTDIIVDKEYIKNLLIEEKNSLSKTTIKALEDLYFGSNNSSVFRFYYKEGLDGGRLYTENTNAYAIPKKYREKIFPEYTSVDMDCSHETIKLNILKQLGINTNLFPLHEEYVNNKRQFRYNLSKEFNLRIKDTKNVLTAISYGCRIPKKAISIQANNERLAIEEEKNYGFTKAINNSSFSELQEYYANKKNTSILKPYYNPSWFKYCNQSLINNDMSKISLDNLLNSDILSQYIKENNDITNIIIDSTGFRNNQLETITFKNEKGQVRNVSMYTNRKSKKGNRIKTSISSFKYSVMSFLCFGVESIILQNLQNVHIGTKTLKSYKEKGVGLYIHDGILVHNDLVYNFDIPKIFHEWIQNNLGYNVTYSVNEEPVYFEPVKVESQNDNIYTWYKEFEERRLELKRQEEEKQMEEMEKWYSEHVTEEPEFDVAPF